MRPHKDSSASVPDTLAASSTPVFYGWWIVGATMLSLIVGIGPIIGLTFGVFLKPLIEEFGWSRGQAAQGVSLALLGFALTQPLIGRLIGRYGAKRIILSSAFFFGLGLLCFSFLVAGLGSFYTCAITIGVMASGTSPLPYGTIIARWFVRRRGLALSLALSGLGIGGIMLPLLTSSTIAARGWRAAFVLLGALVLGIILPVVGLLVRETPEEMGLLPDGHAPGDHGPAGPLSASAGCSLAEARNTTTFWAMALGFLLLTAAVQGCVVHLAPLLTDRGFSLTRAAAMVSLLSVGFLPGMLSSGYLVDRLSAPSVAAGFFSIAIAGFALLWQADSGHGVALAAVLLGVGMGAMVQLIPALVGWCFGLRAFSEIYGMLMAAFGLGTVMGPLLVGWLFDMSGSYHLVPELCVVATLLATGLIASLRKHTAPSLDLT